MDKHTNPFFDAGWLGLQQQYIDALASLNSVPGDQAKDIPPSGPAQPAWLEALEHWRKAVEVYLPETGRPVFDNILNQTRAFYSIADDFAGLLLDISRADSQSDDWRSMMANHFGRMKSRFDPSLTVGKAPDPLPAFFPAALLDSWKSAAAAMAFLPVQMFDSPVQDSFEKLIVRFMKMPGIGPGREHQERLAEALRLWNDYRNKLREYESVLASLGKRALDRLEQSILELAARNGRITSLKQLYDLWIDANEEVFARFAFNEDHARLYGELVNALMRFRQKFNEIMDEILAAMNLPTGAAMQTVYKRQQQLHRQFSRMQAELERIHAAMGKQVRPRRNAAGEKKGKSRRKSG